MTKINGDLIPSSSGQAHLGINGSAGSAFDITTLSPFGNIHMNSGVFHDPILGQSGVIRYSRAAAAFQVSVDGGRTFADVASTANTVTSIGVIGDANLTGNVDLATPSSGFLSIFDTGDASPINFAVNTLGLSGLWAFPPQGFNGQVVNALTDFNGTSAQGVINVVGASGIVVDIIGQTMTITAGNTLVRAYAENFTNTTSQVFFHNLNTLDVLISVYDDQGQPQEVIPDMVELTDANSVTIKFNVLQSGRVVIIGF